MGDIKITLETLYDVLRNEKKREDLQKLESSFFEDVVNYLREKKILLEMKKESTDIFAAGEKEKLEYELRSIKRILKEIYEKREKKIIDIALNRSRTGSDIIDTSSMLREEKEFYEKILFSLDTFRKGVLLNLFQGQMPITEPSPFIKFEATPALTSEEGSELASLPPLTLPPKPGMVNIKFIRPVPSFIWKDMKTYGPFDVGETTEIFPEVADLLVRKGRAEKV